MTITHMDRKIRSTTVVVVRGTGGDVAIGCDGQVTLGDRILKPSAVKIRGLYNGSVLAGFAGSTADALSLFELFEGQLEKYRGDLPRAAVELAKEWRTSRVLRRLEAVLLVADKADMLLISGNGDVIKPDENYAAVGSGAGYAIAALKALYGEVDLTARELTERSINIAAELCIYTNSSISIMELSKEQE
jgi:ATP-dependent HslUV protease subunit HslV